MLLFLWGQFRLEKGSRVTKDLDECLLVGSGLRCSTSCL